MEFLHAQARQSNMNVLEFIAVNATERYTRWTWNKDFWQTDEFKYMLLELGIAAAVRAHEIELAPPKRTITIRDPKKNPPFILNAPRAVVAPGVRVSLVGSPNRWGDLASHKIFCYTPVMNLNTIKPLAEAINQTDRPYLKFGDIEQLEAKISNQRKKKLANPKQKQFPSW